MAKNGLLPAATTLLLLLVSLTPIRATADVDIDVVLDVQGNPLEAGAEYYIKPAGFGFRGGVRRSPLPGPTGCPLFVIESPLENDIGQAVKLIPAHETQQYIRLSSDVQIDSGFSHYCQDDGLWRLRPGAKRVVVVASGAPEISRTWFRITKADNGGIEGAYKITHHPTYTNLGLYVDKSTRAKYLGLTADTANTFHITFIKKTTATTRTVAHKASATV